jgi:hypothetical protein
MVNSIIASNYAFTTSGLLSKNQSLFIHLPPNEMKRKKKHLLVIKAPILFQEQKSLVDELYWQVIRFTSVGFGDEFRDVSEHPSHIPSVVNVLTVGFILLPFGISITSFFFQMYRKVFGKQRKWIDVTCKKVQRKTMDRVKKMNLTNGVIKLRDSPNTHSTNLGAGDSNLIAITEIDAVS